MSNRGKNLVIIIGSLGADPEVRTTNGGSTITSIRVATSEQWTDKATGQKQERTEWHRIKFFGRLAEIAGEYLKKGKQVYVEGSLRTDKYTDKEGIERYSTDIIASEMQMLGGGERDAGSKPHVRRDKNGNSLPPYPDRSFDEQFGRVPQQADFVDDDLPF